MNDQNRLNQHPQRVALHNELNARPAAPHRIQRLMA